MNKRKDYSIRKPTQSIAGLLSVTDSANIDFTFLNNNLTADLTLTGVTAGTYGDATNVPQFIVDQWGRITGVTLVPISGGGGGILTLDNGLTLTGTNGQWGGTLIKDTTITAGGFWSLFDGTLNAGSLIGLLRAINSGNSPSIYGSNTGSGIGIRASSNTNIGVYGTSSSNTAGYFLSSSGNGVIGDTNAAVYGGRFNTRNVNTNTVLSALQIFRGVTGGSGADGIGVGLDFAIAGNNGGAITNIASRLISKFTNANVTGGNQNSEFSIRNKNSGTDEEQFTLNSLGRLKLNNYGIGTFTGTAAYNLAVDTSGNVIEVTAGGSTPNIAIYPYNEASFISDINPLELSFFPTINILAVPANNTGLVRLYDVTTNEQVGTINLTGATNAFHIPAINEIWVSVLAASTISRYDDSTNVLLGTFVNGGNRATEGVIDPVSGYMYWTNLGSSSISVVNPATLTVVTTFASATIGGTLPKGICYNNNPLSAMYQMIVAVVSGTSELCVINPATNTVTVNNLNPSSSLSSPQYITYSETLDRYYVSNSGNNTVAVLEPTSATAFSLDTVITGTLNAYGIEIDDTLGLIYVCGGQLSGGVNAPNAVLVYVCDLSTNTIVRVVVSSSINTTTTTVFNLAIDTTNGYLYCNGYGGVANSSITTKLKLKP